MVVSWRSSVHGDRLPCIVRLLKVPHDTAEFYDFTEFDALVRAAAAVSTQAEVVVMLGGEAGLRAGEMRALEWPDVLQWWGSGEPGRNRQREGEAAGRRRVADDFRAKPFRVERGMVSPEGIEPSTNRLRVCCSAS